MLKIYNFGQKAFESRYNLISTFVKKNVLFLFPCLTTNKLSLLLWLL